MFEAQIFYTNDCFGSLIFIAKRHFNFGKLFNWRSGLAVIQEADELLKAQEVNHFVYLESRARLVEIVYFR